MSSTKTIAIVGATGNQGRSVARAFFSLPDWQVRAITRNPSSDAAKALEAKGADVVQADLTDVESLTRAFTGATAIFLNTDFWLPYGAALAAGESRETASEIGISVEVSHVKNAADAAATIPTLHRLVYSALGPMKEASKGKFPHCGHWDAKAAGVDYIETKPELKGKASYIYPAAYHTNAFLLPKKYPHLGDEYALMLPGPITTNIPVIDIDTTIGQFVRCLIVDEEAGLSLFAYDTDLLARTSIEEFNKFTGKKATFVQETMEGMHKITGLPYEVLDGPAFLAEHHFMDGVRGKVIEPKDLKNKPKTKTFAEILAERGMENVLGDVHPDL